MGRARWNAAAQPSVQADAKPRGRPSKVNNMELVRKVESVLAQFSQPSSRLSWNAQQKDWVLAPRLNLRKIFKFSMIQGLEYVTSSCWSRIFIALVVSLSPVCMNSVLCPWFLACIIFPCLSWTAMCFALTAKVNTLTQDKLFIWNQHSEIQQDLSLSVFHKIARRHLRHYKSADSINDYCIYCWDLKKKVMPQVTALLETVRKDLSELMEGYFTQWDSYEEACNLKERPGLHLRELRHFIQHHCERAPCSRHANNAFPCGLLSLRTRGSGFQQRKRIDLHAAEATACLNLQQTSKLLDSYLFHRSANDFQKPLLSKLLEQPPGDSIVILSDFKELVTLPLRSVATGEEFFANARKEISVFGCIISERQSDTNATVLWTHVLIIADILDHTSCRASQCIEEALRQRRGSATLKTIHLISDAGPHFRSYEAVHYSCCVMPRKHNARVVVHFGVEKHFKSEADRLFALFEKYVKAARMQQKDLVEISHLCTFLRTYNASQRRSDPTSPVLVVLDGCRSQKVPLAERKRITFKHFHITRTYCLSSTPVEGLNTSLNLGVRIFNHTYSNMVACVNLTPEACLEDSRDTAPVYRRGYWNETGRSRWDHDVQPLGLHDETSLTRRQTAQSANLPQGANASFSILPQARCLIEKRKRRSDKGKQRRLDKKQLLEQREDISNSSESSSSSSDSDSSSEGWKQEHVLQRSWHGTCFPGKR